MELGVSVIICCFNSSQRLPETLKQLALQQVASIIPWEIIIVNNCSRDNTVTIAKEEWNKYGAITQMTIIDEHKPGLAYAREAGIKAAKYEYLIFCDDDNWLCESYVATAYEIMEAHAEAGLAGGYGNAVCEITPPDWFEQKKGGYAVSTGSVPTGDITANGHLCGAGMVLRKSVMLSFYKAGFRSLLTDRNGTLLTSGGDAEISKWHILAGYTLWFDEKLKFDHYISKERLTEDYVKRLWEGFKTSAPVEIAYDRFICFQQELKKKGRISMLFKNIGMALLAVVFQKKFRSKFYLYAQNIQLCLNGIIPYDKNLLQVQKMITKPLQQLKSINIF